MTDFDAILQPGRVFLVQVRDFLPRLGVAIVIVVIGWLLAKLVRFAIIKALRAVNFHVVSSRAGLDSFLQNGGIEADTTEILGILAYWLVLLGALVAGFNSLGLTYVTDLLGRIVFFVPKVMVALLIIAFGAYFARFIGHAITAWCRNARIQDAELLGAVGQYAILTFVVLMALDQMDIGGDIVRHSFLIVLAGLVLALALAFGFGGREWAADMLERWWPRRRR